MKRNKKMRIPGRVFRKWESYANNWIAAGAEFEDFDGWARIEAFVDGTPLNWIEPLSGWVKRSWDVWRKEWEGLIGNDWPKLDKH